MVVLRYIANNYNKIGKLLAQYLRSLTIRSYNYDFFCPLRPLPGSVIKNYLPLSAEAFFKTFLI